MRGEALVALLEERLRREPAETWVERLARAGVPAAPVLDVAQVAEHEQTQALGMLQELDGVPAVAVPLSLDGERIVQRARPPRVGEHTAAVLREAGYAEDERIAALAESGAVALGNGPAR